MIPLSVWNGSDVAAGAPRYQPAKPGRPAPAWETTSLTRTWKLAHWRRRVAWQGWPTGSEVFLSGWPSAWMRAAIVRAEFVPNGRAAPSPSAARTIVFFVASVDVVVGADVVVDDASLPLEQPAPAAARSTTDSTTRAARRARMAVMAAHSSQWAPSSA